MKIRVSLIDDHPVVLKGLENMLDEWPGIELLDVCSLPSELLNCLKKRQPDVLLLDAQMPKIRGHELAAIIHKEHPAIAILVLTNNDLPYQVNIMIENGAMGYLLKSAEPTTLLHAIETVNKGQQYIDPMLNESLFNDIINSRNTSIPAITQREKEILELIVNEFTSQEISAKLKISNRTVENHRINLLLKLGVKNTAGLVRKAVQLKLV